MKYHIEEGSHSGHCCFDYTVMEGESVLCECFAKSDADTILAALNNVSISMDTAKFCLDSVKALKKNLSALRPDSTHMVTIHRIEDALQDAINRVKLQL